MLQKTSGSEKVLEKKGEYQEFQSKAFCITAAENLVAEQPFCAVFQRISGSEKVLKKRGKDYQNFQSIVFCLTVPKSLVGEQPYPSVLCFREIPAAKKF